MGLLANLHKNLQHTLNYRSSKVSLNINHNSSDTAENPVLDYYQVRVYYKPHKIIH